ncbi:LysM-like peptidoglycan-binding domain-containing protein [Edwardsiella piscicida]|uniref:LysM-like peptidoglycan-binding domain-containing protein n=1 Tax=Edwardsiella piscicida TaxID=1263550 RepID=UPI00054CAE51|nr:LysM-like peptidoglycan-binding domain-containing protein [Edwardsiella piscicida]EKS7766854.1 cell envelope opacity-associated protein A [Edwardsiella piscicida]EKS7813497.1 cell envelope opacity-associated protein A [Edwardsiella piscicida]ELM3659118.1 cell envelope opacity-associated protein A [Edwardsiella piscicida]UCQ21456.1 cell envelope opacity-associated protein A [Edwardsiella piscicida]UCQ41518.1 cell envelope opacity-associated protein A [Edwardsiella piscicida]
MGRIAPKKHKVPAYSGVAIQDIWRRLRQGIALSAVRLRKADLRRIPRRCRTALRTLWHWPDHIDWMAPLPALHRRWLTVACAVLLLALLWPSDDAAPPRPSPALQTTASPMQATLQPQREAPTPSDANDWQAYPILPGQTLAQLLREHNLDVTDAFAMARVEGDDRPLSNLKAGQHVMIRRGPQGQILALKLETTDDRQIAFRRESDGSFIRLR